MIMLNVSALFVNSFAAGVFLQEKGFVFYLNLFCAFMNLVSIAVKVYS